MFAVYQFFPFSSFGCHDDDDDDKSHSVVSNSVRPHRRQPTRPHRPWDSPDKNTGVDCHFLLQCMKVKSECEVAQSCPTLSDPMDCSLPGSSFHGDSQGKNPGVGFHALLQGIFPTQGSNPGLLHYRWILYHLSHQGSTRILECIPYPFYRVSSPPRNLTGVSCIAGGFFTS